MSTTLERVQPRLSMTPLRWSNLFHFKPEEFAVPAAMDYMLLFKLDQTRILYRQPMIVTSSNEPRDNEDSAHVSGHAVDIRCHTSRDRYRLVDAAMRAGFARIGVYDNHIHLDNDPSRPAPVLWVGVSK